MPARSSQSSFKSAIAICWVCDLQKCGQTNFFRVYLPLGLYESVEVVKFRDRR